jgi:hypothetical protein
MDYYNKKLKKLIKTQILNMSFTPGQSEPDILEDSFVIKKKYLKWSFFALGVVTAGYALYKTKQYALIEWDSYKKLVTEWKLYRPTVVYNEN